MLFGVLISPLFNQTGEEVKNSKLTMLVRTNKKVSF